MELSRDSPKVISGNHGKRKSGWLDQESNPGPHECEFAVGVVDNTGALRARRVKYWMGNTDYTPQFGAAVVVQWLDFSPPTWVGPLPNFRMWKLCVFIPLVGGFSRGYPVSPAFTFRRCSIFTSHRPHGLYKHLNVKSRPNLFTHALYTRLLRLVLVTERIFLLPPWSSFPVTVPVRGILDLVRRGLQSLAALMRLHLTLLQRLPLTSREHRSTQKTVTPFEFRSGLEIEMKFISNPKIGGSKSRSEISSHRRQMHSDTGGNNALSQRPMARTCKALNRRAVLPSTRLTLQITALLDESPISTTARTLVLLVSVLELTIVLLVHTTPDTTLYFISFIIGRSSTNGEPS
ncbi:hypothetical protein PR048_003757 [Dryococelus australis]|uniref:Uncharacterized protein n=1 Tax=Dryococelus australis TaxID=614101 RepID=A0ABQ9IP30_9NEOP|nr:hypothetical protein PR048_003757 [Dryococelus australis]